MFKYFVGLKFLNQIFDEISLYNKITDISSNKKRKVNTVLKKNKYGNISIRLFKENK